MCTIKWYDWLQLMSNKYPELVFCSCYIGIILLSLITSLPLKLRSSWPFFLCNCIVIIFQLLRGTSWTLSLAPIPIVTIWKIWRTLLNSRLVDLYLILWKEYTDHFHIRIILWHDPLRSMPGVRQLFLRSRLFLGKVYQYYISHCKCCWCCRLVILFLVFCLSSLYRHCCKFSCFNVSSRR